LRNTALAMIGQFIKFTPRLVYNAVMYTEYKRTEAIACPSGFVGEPRWFSSCRRDNDETANNSRV